RSGPARVLVARRPLLGCCPADCSRRHLNPRTRRLLPESAQASCLVFGVECLVCRIRVSVAIPVALPAEATRNTEYYTPNTPRRRFAAMCAARVGAGWR